MSADKTLGEIAAERDERALYLSDPDLYDALVRTEPETVHLTAEMAASPVLHSTPAAVSARFSDALLAEVFEADAEALTLRTVIERLDYAVTEEIDAILRANPTGPWSLGDLETMFGPRAPADAHPHEVRFVEWVGADDGDEDTRL
ncbi:hypothetical protein PAPPERLAPAPP_00500 [Brevundimonas phage vB_BpoS-Papperlapapp]|uniref:Uncharacterized protein n=1 Tax=Brevundimonas phage vB_BpoS-Domovoi TaxID=2948598 RepID=A0A9E7MSF9_9CAUD|nr:hypothetical protein DOMOVOI_05270 [Brevundimonas phage vB_BpoS-Domovoi]USN15792.1 hypothetical protein PAPPERLAPAPP_00500 [Brevundimonas phage vB_BpoS-Papperlapapp]